MLCKGNRTSGVQTVAVLYIYKVALRGAVD